MRRAVALSERGSGGGGWRGPRRAAPAATAAPAAPPPPPAWWVTAAPSSASVKDGEWVILSLLFHRGFDGTPDSEWALEVRKGFGRAAPAVEAGDGVVGLGVRTRAGVWAAAVVISSLQM